MAIYDTIDVDFTWDGDFTKGSDGDLGDTSDDVLRSLRNTLRDLVKSAAFDWLGDPTFAADLNDFIGKGNTRDTGRQITDRIRSKIISFNIVKPEDLDIKVLPIHINQIMIMIKVLVTPTADNGLTAGEPVIVSMVYDTQENNIYFLDQNTKNNDPFA